MSMQATCSEVAQQHLRLHLASGVGSITFGNLTRHFGTAEAVLRASRTALQEVEGIGPKTADAIRAATDSQAWKDEVLLAQQMGVRILCREDPEYPRPLAYIADPPICLYTMGELRREDTLSLAIVGSRQASLYGIEQAQRFAELLCRAGLTVVSGMARGVDQAAHMAAMRSGGRTIAVQGCGLCHCYPPESVDLRDKIRTTGAVVSELPLQTQPQVGTFPPRNRIIAGLCLGTLVIEAGQRSGALITARLANEYNREVFALPGRIDTQQSEGTNDLIRKGYAKLVTRLEDILDELGEAGKLLAQGQASTPNNQQVSPARTAMPHKVPATGPDTNVTPDSDSPTESLPSTQTIVYDTLGTDPMHMEQIGRRCDLAISQVSAALTLLQLRGLVKQLPGNLFARRK